VFAADPLFPGGVHVPEAELAIAPRVRAEVPVIGGGVYAPVAVLASALSVGAEVPVIGAGVYVPLPAETTPPRVTALVPAKPDKNEALALDEIAPKVTADEPVIGGGV
jgi:hypothetical protein